MTLCLMGKWPLPGNVKTRLGRSIGVAEATALASAFLDDAAADLFATGHPVRLALDGAPRGARDRPAFAGCLVEEQGEGDLGVRMARVLCRAIAAGRPWAIVLGSDIVGLPAEHLNEGIDALRRDGGSDAVIGPVRDGGYYLLGVRAGSEAHLARALEGVRFSTPFALEDTQRGLARARLSVHVLPSFFDVDRAEDLPVLKAHLRAHPECPAPATRRALGC